MKHTVAVSLTLFALVVPVAHADTQHKQGMSKDHAMMAQQMTGGEVKKLDASRGTITLKHGDIPGVMPAMTMGYRAADPKQLAGLKAGDKVRFTVEKQGVEYVLTHIEIMQH